MMYLLQAASSIAIPIVLFSLSSFQSVLAFEAFITNERSGDILSVDKQGNINYVQAICNRPRGMVKGLNESQLLIACSDDSKVILVDIGTREIKRTYHHLDGAMTLAIHRMSRRLFVTNEGHAQATVVDLDSGLTIATLPTGLEPDGIVVSDIGNQVFVASENAGLVHVFDADSYKQTGVILTHLRPRRLALLNDRLWVSSEMGSRVEIFSIETLEKIDEVVFSPKGFRSEQMTPVDIIFDQTETMAFVALGSANNIAFVNVDTLEVEKYILVGRRAWGLGLSPDNTSLIVLNGLSDDFTIIDIESRRPRVTKRAGLIPHAIQVFEQ